MVIPQAPQTLLDWSSPPNNVATSNDPFGNPGYANDAFSVVGLPTDAEGEVMYLMLSADIGDAYITDATWSVIAATNPPATPPLNSAIIGHNNPELISYAPAGLPVRVTPNAGIGGTGLTITVIPEPSTAGLLAGLLALSSVLLRRRAA